MHNRITRPPGQFYQVCPPRFVMFIALKTGHIGFGIYVGRRRVKQIYSMYGLEVGPDQLTPHHSRAWWYPPSVSTAQYHVCTEIQKRITARKVLMFLHGQPYGIHVLYDMIVLYYRLVSGHGSRLWSLVCVYLLYIVIQLITIIKESVDRIQAICWTQYSFSSTITGKMKACSLLY